MPEKELELACGDSVCVNGSCLTVVSIAGRNISFDVSPETSGRVSPVVIGETVNLERSMKADGRLHGHFVTGHVDCTGTVIGIKKLSSFCQVTVSFPRKFSRFLVEKGSVAVSGISLTVASLTERDFSIALIPETLKSTSAGQWKQGTRVNLEFDIIGKYIVKAAETAASKESLRNYLEKYRPETR